MVPIHEPQLPIKSDEPNPAGNRATRRSKQRHHPYFTKKRTGGRLWEIGVRDIQRERAAEKKKDG